MCFLLFAVHHHPDYPLIVAANRDEYLNRRSEPAQFRSDNPMVLAGRDVVAGGTWLGITRQGRFAALTNYRNPEGHDDSCPSRGALVSDFLYDRERTPAASYIDRVDQSGVRYNGFNLIAGAGATLIHYASKTREMTLLSPGVHALSNALLDTPWPKAIQGTRTMTSILHKPGKPDIDALLALLGDQNPAPDDALPVTGVDLETERGLSPIFIRHGNYGTRCSTIITVRDDGEVTFMERSYASGANEYNDVSFRFDIIE